MVASTALAALLLLLSALLGALLVAARNMRRASLPWPRPPGTAVRTMVVLGSGGHTAEMLALLDALDLQRYTPRVYVVAATDSGSAAKAHAFEAAAASRRGVSLPACSRYEVRVIRRSREVGQSYVSSCWTTLRACVDALCLLAAQRPQLLLCNGPGTCLPLVACACALRAVGSPFACGVVFVESVARVRRLSLTGQLLYRARMADAFFVQWEALAKQLPRARCLGRLL